MEVYKVALVICLSLVASVNADGHSDKWAKCKVEKEVAGKPIEGVIMMHQKDKETKFNISLTGFNTTDANEKHGFHIHENGATGDNCKDAGGHYNPEGKNHGAPEDAERHVGDLGNVEEKDGKVMAVIKDQLALLDGDKSIIGKAIVVHLLEDDLGKGGASDSLTTGAAGARIACCVIEEYTPPPPPVTTTPDCVGKECGSSGGTKTQYWQLLSMCVALLAAFC